ncbi:hypothetical protein P879_10745 [Paragonimus westermani]|uniref:Helicase C-terminal domain-containing protein n=1 Tax=Paragonimus westermani TaxID=34504 RepID=A0A8T0DEU2_9TREM|nr:hypothetical protein P879_10745 [Paragonimus westermani]
MHRDRLARSLGSSLRECCELTHPYLYSNAPVILNNRSFPYDVPTSPLVRSRLHLCKSVHFPSLILLLPQILIATSTLAWGVNFPAYLVVVKGTEFYDGKTTRYVDYSITDVLQMMDRAGRPQFDDQGKAVIMVEDTKKRFTTASCTNRSPWRVVSYKCFLTICRLRLWPEQSAPDNRPWTI